MLYGDYKVDFQAIVRYLESNYGFKSTWIRELEEKDFKDGQLSIQAEDDLDTSIAHIEDCIKNWE